eukprot:1157942-Pelagomonas_calceolata.AAC.1
MSWMSSAWRWVLNEDSFHAHWVKGLFRNLREAGCTIRGSSVCPSWSATRIPASSALLMVFVGPCPLDFMCDLTQKGYRWHDCLCGYKAYISISTMISLTQRASSGSVAARSRCHRPARIHPLRAPHHTQRPVQPARAIELDFSDPDTQLAIAGV